MSRPTNVVRIDTYNTHGWQVRITRHRNRHTKFFSDARYGNSEKAFEAAEAYRDEKLQELPEPLPGTRMAAQARSTSGVPGVRLNIEHGGARIEADAIVEDGKRRVKTYSLRRWGLRKALWNACKWKGFAVHGGCASRNRDRDVQHCVPERRPTTEKEYEAVQDARERKSVVGAGERDPLPARASHNHSAQNR